MTLDLFYQNLNNLADLSADQQAQILAAIEAYDFSAIPNGAAWQQAVVAAFKAGDWKPAQLGALVSGAIAFARCP